MLYRINEGSEIYVLSNFLSDAECDALVARSEAAGYEEAKIDMGGKQQMLKAVRDNERVLYKDEAYAVELWARLRPHIPPVIGNSTAIGLNELFRFYKYSSGQRFKMHADGSYIRNETEFSYYTFMIYLNDHFEGGVTNFYSGEFVAPHKGTALIFEHSLRHEGSPVTAGVKYVLRSDVMYELQEQQGR